MWITGKTGWNSKLASFVVTLQLLLQYLFYFACSIRLVPHGIHRHRLYYRHYYTTIVYQYCVECRIGPSPKRALHWPFRFEFLDFKKQKIFSSSANFMKLKNHFERMQELSPEPAPSSSIYPNGLQYAMRHCHHCSCRYCITIARHSFFRVVVRASYVWKHFIIWFEFVSPFLFSFTILTAKVVHGKHIRNVPSSSGMESYCRRDILQNDDDNVDIGIGE